MRRLVLLTLLLGSPAWAGYADLVLADAPIAYWRLGESTGSTAIDAVGTNDGSYGGFVTLGVSGAIDDADSAIATVGGAASKVTIPTDASLTPAQFTIELWARPTGAPGMARSPATYRDLVTASNISGWQMLLNAGGNWEFSIGRGNVGSGSAWNTIEGPPAAFGSWTHLVGSYDGADMRLYVDGALAGELLSVGYLPVDAFFFFINFFIGAGRSEDVSATGDLFWIGEIDEVALYDRALDAATVGAHFEAASGSLELAPIVSARKSGGEVHFGFPTELGADYRLRRADGASWIDVDAPIAGSGDVEERGDALTAGGELEIYRVEVER